MENNDIYLNMSDWKRVRFEKYYFGFRYMEFNITLEYREDVSRNS